jgi:hypothetical protein
MRRLDAHGDNYKNIPVTIQLGQSVEFNPGPNPTTSEFTTTMPTLLKTRAFFSKNKKYFCFKKRQACCGVVTHG